jgi:hypothetical protein
VVSGVEPARHEQRLVRNLRVVDEHRRRDALRHSRDLHAEGRDAGREIVRELFGGLAGLGERRGLVLSDREARDDERLIARFDELAEGGQSLRDRISGGRHVHDRVGGLVRFERPFEVAAIAARFSLFHERARLLAIGGRRTLRPGRAHARAAQKNRNGEGGRESLRSQSHLCPSVSSARPSAP